MINITDDQIKDLILLTNIVEITPNNIALLHEHFPKYRHRIVPSKSFTLNFPKPELTQLRASLYVNQRVQLRAGARSSTIEQRGLDLASDQPLHSHALAIPFLKRGQKGIRPTLYEQPASSSRFSYEDTVFFCQQRLISVICSMARYKDGQTKHQYEQLQSLADSFQSCEQLNAGEIYFCGLFAAYADKNYELARTYFLKVPEHSGALFELALLYFNSSYSHQKSCVAGFFKLGIARPPNNHMLNSANNYCSQAIFHPLPNPSALALKALIYSLHPRVLEQQWTQPFMLHLPKPTQHWSELALASGSLMAFQLYNAYFGNKKYFRYTVFAEVIESTYHKYELMFQRIKPYKLWSIGETLYCRFQRHPKSLLHIITDAMKCHMYYAQLKDHRELAKNAGCNNVQKLSSTTLSGETIV